MSDSDTVIDLSSAAVIIPALDEAENLALLLPQLASMGLGQILVCDNGSTDATPEVTIEHGAEWVHEPTRGYGAACYAGMERLSPSVSVVVFMDADLAEDANLIATLVSPITSGQCDLVIGARGKSLRDPGATTLPQRLANRLMPYLIRLGWGHTYTDLGPFRAIRRSSLEAINMQDRAYGWTIEMQVKAVESQLRIREIPVPHRIRRHGQSKISGTVKGTFLAAYWITRTCAGLWLSKRRRLRALPREPERTPEAR